MLKRGIFVCIMTSLLSSFAISKKCIVYVRYMLSNLLKCYDTKSYCIPRLSPNVMLLVSCSRYKKSRTAKSDNRGGKFHGEVGKAMDEDEGDWCCPSASPLCSRDIPRSH